MHRGPDEGPLSTAECSRVVDSTPVCRLEGTEDCRNEQGLWSFPSTSVRPKLVCSLDLHWTGLTRPIPVLSSVGTTEGDESRVERRRDPGQVYPFVLQRCLVPVLLGPEISLKRDGTRCMSARSPGEGPRSKVTTSPVTVRHGD